MFNTRTKRVLWRCASFLCLLLPINPALAEELDYDHARWDPIHFKPAIDTATNEQCLTCHQEILERRVLPKSPAGVKADESLAWYQTLDVYGGEQDTFHRRHLVTSLATSLMNLQCNFCHQGNNPREEAPVPPTSEQQGHNLRKMVNPETTCLKCHGEFNYQVMNLPGPWHEIRDQMGNDCLTCHAAFRTVRHQVNYLNAQNIEIMGKANSDTCYGCHGGRSWYRIAYPYPRNPWPGMSPATPDWAKDRPAESETRFRLQKTAAVTPVPDPAHSIDTAKAAQPSASSDAPSDAPLSDEAMLKLMADKGYICMSCHQVAVKVVGPSYQEIATRYAEATDATKTQLANSIKNGGVGTWGQIPMPANPTVTEEDLNKIVAWILAMAQ